MTTDLETIRQFITTQFLFDFDERVTEHANLYELGLIDSYGFVELVRFLELEFEISFTEDELVSDALQSLANIQRIVRAKVDAHR